MNINKEQYHYTVSNLKISEGWFIFETYNRKIWEQIVSRKWLL